MMARHISPFSISHSFLLIGQVITILPVAHVHAKSSSDGFKDGIDGLLPIRGGDLHVI